VDVDDQTVTFSGGVVEFELDPDVKHRLLHGLDEIGLTLRNEAAIARFEASGGADRGPVTTAL
jgi:3-isopropylmalate/(R)-2-methylmalate dehydratase small subunit